MLRSLQSRGRRFGSNWSPLGYRPSCWWCFEWLQIGSQCSALQLHAELPSAKLHVAEQPSAARLFAAELPVAEPP
jgi:hypothetical protein